MAPGSYGHVPGHEEEGPGWWHDHIAPLGQRRWASTAERTEHGKVGRVHTQSAGVHRLGAARFSPCPLPPSCSRDSTGSFERDITNLTRYGAEMGFPSPYLSAENCFTVLQGNEHSAPLGTDTRAGGSRSLASSPPLPSFSIFMQLTPSSLEVPAPSFLLKWF